MPSDDAAMDQGELEALLGRAAASLPASAPDSRYRLELEPRSWCLFLRISGTVLQPVPDEFHERIAALVKGGGIRRAVVDASGCTYISSAALGVLAEFLLGAHREGAQVVILQPNQRIRAAMRLVGLDHLFLVVDNEAMAEAYFTSSEQAADGA